MADTFPQFSKLPVELRSHIWRLALPTPIQSPTLFVWRPDRWQFFRVPEQHSEFEKRYAQPGKKSHLAMRYQHEALNPIPIDLPLTFVNRESRNIAQTYIQAHGLIPAPKKHSSLGQQEVDIKKKQDKDDNDKASAIDTHHQPPTLPTPPPIPSPSPPAITSTYYRSMNPLTDYLYFPSTRWHLLGIECWTTTEASRPPLTHLSHPFSTKIITRIRRIAIPIHAVMSGPFAAYYVRFLHEVSRVFPQLEEILCITEFVGLDGTVDAADGHGDGEGTEEYENDMAREHKSGNGNGNGNGEGRCEPTNQRNALWHIGSSQWVLDLDGVEVQQREHLKLLCGGNAKMRVGRAIQMGPLFETV